MEKVTHFHEKNGLKSSLKDWRWKHNNNTVWHRVMITSVPDVAFVAHVFSVFPGLHGKHQPIKCDFYF